MIDLLNAFTSCSSLLIPCITIIAIVWKKRDQIENFYIGPNGIEIKFGKRNTSRSK